MGKSRPLATHLAVSHGTIGLLACLATGLLLALLLPGVHQKQRQRALVREGQALAQEVAPLLARGAQHKLVLTRPEGAGVFVIDAQQQIVARSAGQARGGRGWGWGARGRGRGMMHEPGAGPMHEAGPGAPHGPGRETERVWKKRWQSLLSGEIIQGTTLNPHGERIFVAAIPAEHGGKIVGAVVLHARAAELRGAANALLPIIVLSSLAVALLAVLAGVWLSRRMAEPLRQMTEAARKVAQGDLTVAVEPPSWREGQSLAQAFNTMTRSLAAQEAARRQFIADASHQLRAPLTSLRAQAEALLDEVVTDEATRRTFLLRMIEETKRLSSLAQELLDLERLDSGQAPPQRRQLDVAALVRSVAEAFAADESASLDLQLPADLPSAQADPDEVRQALVNLMDNAFKHTPPGGRVQVSARPDQDMVRIAVADEGPGIPPEHLPHIWDRFYRVPGDSTEGSGLGLAIAKRLVERQGGAVFVESEPGHGATFSFTLPAASR